MRNIFQFLSYLRYLYLAKNEHSIHSPFIFDLYTNIIKERKPKTPTETLERLVPLLTIIGFFGIKDGLNSAMFRKISNERYTFEILYGF